ncbi:hypothetical protein K437DRAFT_23264 [Tilletiaria anomala UBC 951]|uniref:Uncharacterized protein n=1 Tax=Tilletiaria anomala (strain ATCC 24038 / CBS 436.72 / UBC 951) TaxID=1037660 RepID=A0A066VDS8_TILAU|nr:uncharacterized protein K437DRAFT_23264 [Tilletiaria anomala UBC 951]KDN38453.1 hypothetical protein K437DRAFT_23264 [Tilletiaria anomala UBC 951]
MTAGYENSLSRSIRRETSPQLQPHLPSIHQPKHRRTLPIHHSHLEITQTFAAVALCNRRRIRVAGREESWPPNLPSLARRLPLSPPKLGSQRESCRSSGELSRTPATAPVLLPVTLTLASASAPALALAQAQVPSPAVLVSNGNGKGNGSHNCANRKSNTSRCCLTDVFIYFGT